MTIPVSFGTLWSNYPATDEFPNRIPLFDYLGWDDLKKNPAYTNTCAIRMSLCLLRSGIAVPGRFTIKKGRYKGRNIEPGQGKLSNILATPAFFGKPQKFTLAERDAALKGKQGIISFMRIPGYVVDGGLSGHIDLVRHGKLLFFWDALQCRESCYWNSQEFWFWPIA